MEQEPFPERVEKVRRGLKIMATSVYTTAMEKLTAQALCLILDTALAGFCYDEKPASKK